MPAKLCLFLLVIFGLLNPVLVLSVEFSDYYPLTLGETWIYENESNPSDSYTYLVSEPHEIGGQPAVKFGPIGGYQFSCWNDGAAVTWYQVIYEEELIDFEPDIVLGSFEDGAKISFICDSTPCDSVLIRVWEALNAEDIGIYDMDPSYGDLLIWAYYDAERLPNPQNTILEANLPPDVTPPPGAVTDLEWYQAGVGITVFRDVMAETGELGDKYVLAPPQATRSSSWSQVKSAYGAGDH